MSEGPLACSAPPWSYRTSKFAIPDIFHRGEMLWAKGIGIDCCYVGLCFLRDVAGATCVLDPFCGIGTVVALANEMGMSSIGVEISRKRCRQAVRLKLHTALAHVSAGLRNVSMDIVAEREDKRKGTVQVSDERGDEEEEQEEELAEGDRDSEREEDEEIINAKEVF